MKPEKMTTPQLLRAIDILQGVQSQCPPTSERWEAASKLLAPLFSEMHERTKHLHEPR